MVAFYVVAGVNSFCAVLNLLSLGRSSNKRLRVLVFLFNAASIASASWNWVAGVVVLALLLVGVLVASVKTYAEFEQSCVNASIRFNEQEASKEALIQYVRSTRRSEKSARSFGPLAIAQGLECTSSLDLSFRESRQLLPVSMLLSVALSESHDLAIRALVLISRLYGRAITSDATTGFADKYVAAAQGGLPLGSALRELARFRSTALRDHDRFPVEQLLAAMMTLTREGITDVGEALARLYRGGARTAAVWCLLKASTVFGSLLC